MNVDRDTAATWASWFRALGDPSRILVLNLLAAKAEPMSVGEIVEALDIGQSTISHHLKQLAEVGFVLVEERGTSNFYRVNDLCLECFPTAAELVMGVARTTAEWRTC
ncbi:MAG TPA: metalloregulator ArsR/SmtB family transcription factor [Acidimicrobiia bacterium]|jgi:DNA-binding transcriptional ArsR family regulator